jgi:hypothetical protein
MNKYKLIKTYPNSPELGTVVSKGTVGFDDKYPDQYGSLDNTMFFTVKEIENYPEFWEKVKDYEILELSFKRSERPEIRSVIRYSEEYLEALIKCENTIHSIKRLSDNVVFTVGDKVKQSNVQHNNTFTITRFEFDVNNKHLLVVSNGGIKLHKIEHCKTPLFTTEDGVEIFENNHPILYWVKLKKYSLGIDEQNTLHCPDLINYKYFSTKEAAEEYIVMNKPCLSINDLIIIEDKFAMQGMGLIKKAKELVKERI